MHLPDKAIEIDFLEFGRFHRNLFQVLILLYPAMHAGWQV